MRVSWNWLHEFVAFEGSPEELAHRLTMSGIEVGTIESVGDVFTRVRVGEVLQVLSHPDADKLRVCKVSLGDRQCSIVCGAPNVAEGQRVPVIRPGEALPDGRIIEASNIRGETSEGMICSTAELGLEDASDGIWVLAADAKIGASLNDIIPFRDVILEVEITPNRGDCLSILGIAREVASLNRTPLHPPKPRTLEHGAPVKSLATAAVECHDLCPRYAARVVQDVTIGPSPLWLQWRLRTAGIRPINNVVDITNLVMLERGQPLHAFDLEKIREGRITVRRWKPEDGPFVTLDGVERVPPLDACLICDGEGPVAIGGVMGGRNSEVSDQTRHILLESAYFTPTGVRRTAKALGLSTEASYRFERGVDPEGTLLAADRAAELLRTLAGGRVARGSLDVYPRPHEKKIVVLRTSQIKRVLGLALPIREVSDILLSLGMEVMSTDGQQNISIRVPSHRSDLAREIDLIEEVARIHGYNEFPSSLPMGGGELSRQTGSEWSFLHRLRSLLAGAGLTEALNLTLVSAQDAEVGGPSGASGAALRLRNPLSLEGECLRTNLWSGLLKNATLNTHHSVSDIRLFEAGRVFLPNTSGDPEELPREELRVACVLSQLQGRSLWTEQNRQRDFFDIKGLLEYLLAAFGIREIHVQAPAGLPFHPARSATVWLPSDNPEEKLFLGQVGEIHPDMQRKLDIPQSLFLFEIAAEPLRLRSTGTPTFRALPRFPATSRDLAVVVSEDVPTADLQRAILESGRPLVREAFPFDVHTGNPIPPGRKSVAFALLYRSDERTLTGEEVNLQHNAIVERLAERFGADLR